MNSVVAAGCALIRGLVKRAGLVRTLDIPTPVTIEPGCERVASEPMRNEKNERKDGCLICAALAATLPAAVLPCGW